VPLLFASLVLFSRSVVKTTKRFSSLPILLLRQVDFLIGPPWFSPLLLLKRGIFLPPTQPSPHMPPPAPKSPEEGPFFSTFPSLECELAQKTGMFFFSFANPFLVLPLLFFRNRNLIRILVSPLPTPHTPSSGPPPQRPLVRGQPRGAHCFGFFNPGFRPSRAGYLDTALLLLRPGTNKVFPVDGRPLNTACFLRMGRSSFNGAFFFLGPCALSECRTPHRGFWPCVLKLVAGFSLVVGFLFVYLQMLNHLCDTAVKGSFSLLSARGLSLSCGGVILFNSKEVFS